MDNLGKRLFISITPGKTFLDKLQGKIKIRLFLALILILIATWDIRIMTPILIISIIGLFSIKPNLRTIRGLSIFTLLMNLFNLFLIWIVTPDYGLKMVGASTVLFKFTDYFIVTAETLWYFLVRLVNNTGNIVFLPLSDKSTIYFLSLITAHINWHTKRTGFFLI